MSHVITEREATPRSFSSTCCKHWVVQYRAENFRLSSSIRFIRTAWSLRFNSGGVSEPDAAANSAGQEITNEF